MDFVVVIKGIIIGLMVSVPLGPMGMVVVQRTLSKGRLSGFLSGLGAASADTLFSIIAVMGFGFIIDFVEEKRFYFEIVGSLFVIYIGLRIFYSNPVTQIRRRQKKNTLFADYITVFLMTFSNPLAIFVFLALFAAVHFVTESQHYLTSFLIVLGVFAGASLWWFTITTLVSLYRQKFRLKRLWWLNKITGAIISLLGLIALIKVFFIPGLPL